MSIATEVDPMNHDTRSGQDRTRVTIRETRERVSRTLRTTGAGGSRTRTATEQVVFAELHRGTGLAELLDALPTVSWEPAEPVRSDSSPTGAVECVATAGPLQHAVALVDLMAAEPRVPVVVRAELTVSSSLLDEPLSRSARTVGWNLTAWQHVPGSGWRVRSAAPDGSVATGAGEPDRELTELLRTPPPGAVVFHASRRPPRGELSRLDAEQQRARRLEATVRGISVDTAVWQRLGDLAQNFLLRDD